MQDVLPSRFCESSGQKGVVLIESKDCVESNSSGESCVASIIRLGGIHCNVAGTVVPGCKLQR